jgi:ABC-type cobalamin/Fe3+-siderophores transport system ATPase subunit
LPARTLLRCWRTGRIAAFGPPAKVVTARRLRDAYGVDVSTEKLKDGQTVCAPSFAADGNARH